MEAKKDSGLQIDQALNISHVLVSYFCYKKDACHTCALRQGPFIPGMIWNDLFWMRIYDHLFISPNSIMIEQNWNALLVTTPYTNCYIPYPSSPIYTQCSISKQHTCMLKETIPLETSINGALDTIMIDEVCCIGCAKWNYRNRRHLEKRSRRVTGCLLLSPAYARWPLGLNNTLMCW